MCNQKFARNQLQSKFKAGVGRGVDSEQANARLALADSNLTTGEVANLHDVSARYLRIVGEAPAANLPAATELDKGIQAQGTDASAQALARNANISAAQLKTCAPYAPGARTRQRLPAQSAGSRALRRWQEFRWRSQ